jgi:glycosyltransferase involved in cell wall biosynthesis
MAIAAGRLARLPVTVTCHAKDIFHSEYAAGLEGRLSGVTGLVTVSDYNRRHLQAALPGTTVGVVYNAVDSFAPTDPNPDGPVLSVARLVEKKGIDLLIRAAALLDARGQTVEVEIAGDGPLRPQLETMVGEYGLSESVRFLGALTSREVDRAYRRASMFVLPCRIDRNGDRDGLPTVLGEAMSRGLPVISTDLVGIPELVRDGETGLLVPAEDYSALAAAIHNLRAEPDRAYQLGIKGRDHARAILDPATSTRALLEIFSGSARPC